MSAEMPKTKEKARPVRRARCDGRGFVFHHELYTATRLRCPECGGKRNVSRGDTEITGENR